jgi:dUTP pyrophosphatase
MFDFLHKSKKPICTIENRIASFEKVSFEEFSRAVHNIEPFADNITVYNYFPHNTEAYIWKLYENIILPTRSTSGSAGYDFFSAVPFAISPNMTSVIPTGIRCKINDGWFLAIYPRSGLGFKHGMRLLNTTGIIDSDYYYADNEGHIMIKAVTERDIVEIKEGERFCQGIFLPYGLTIYDYADEKRTGGLGSTGK